MIRRINNLTILGFMGTGKSTIGRILENRLRFRLVDTDHEIENRTGKRVSEIFAEEGEARFREYERELILELESVTDAIISAGGGTVLRPDNVSSLRAHSLMVCLWASPATIYRRVKTQGRRPLLATEDPMKTIEGLLEARKAVYQSSADVLISTELRTIPEVAKHVENQFRHIYHKTLAA